MTPSTTQRSRTDSGTANPSHIPAHEAELWRPASEYPQTAQVFLPAPFALVEFDDTANVDRHQARRLLLHANGLVTEPAEQVLLGWASSSGAQATTATRQDTGPFSPRETGRADAISLAGNHAPEGAGAPLLSLQEWTQLQASFGADDPRWSHAEVAVDGRPVDAEVINVDHGSFGWLQHDGLIVAFALRQPTVHELQLQTVTPISATRYHCNPLTPRTWREFVDCNET